MHWHNTATAGVFGAAAACADAMELSPEQTQWALGNAGTQAMTVTVRAIAMRDLGTRNIRRMVTREVMVGFANGLGLALLLGAGAGIWFQDPQLGAVIAVALVINMIVAGLFGSVVPLTINKLKLDPAVASGVFVTTLTDVIGFSAFLGLASWWFGLV